LGQSPLHFIFVVRRGKRKGSVVDPQANEDDVGVAGKEMGNKGICRNYEKKKTESQSRGRMGLSPSARNCWFRTPKK